VAAALSSVRQKLQNIAGITLQYLEVCNGESLAPLDRANKPMVALVAAKLGNVRLIDNIVV
jgi:pantoate--beta-alanine ligase